MQVRAVHPDEQALRRGRLGAWGRAGRWGVGVGVGSERARSSRDGFVGATSAGAVPLERAAARSARARERSSAARSMRRVLLPALRGLRAALDFWLASSVAAPACLLASVRYAVCAASAR